VFREFIFLFIATASRDSSVSIMIRLRSGQPGLDSLQRQGICLFATASRPAPGPTCLLYNM